MKTNYTGATLIEDIHAAELMREEIVDFFYWSRNSFLAQKKSLHPQRTKMLDK